MKFIFNEEQIKRLLDENLLSSLLKSGAKNLFKTGTKELPKTFKYLTDVKSVMKPEIKTLISGERPFIKFSEAAERKFYDLFWADTKLIQKDLKGISASNVGLTEKGTQNLIELTQNSNKLESLINTKAGSKLDLKDYVETMYKMKNQADNLVNEISIVNPKSPNIQTAKNIQSKVNQVVKKNEDLLKNATPSKAAETSVVKKPKPVEPKQIKPKPVEPKQIKPKPVERPAEPKPIEKTPEKVLPKGEFQRLTIQRDKYDIPVTKNGKYLDRFFEKVFYEGFDKRHNMFSNEIISKLTPETKSYLLQLKDIVKQKGLLRGPENGFVNKYGRLPKTVDEEIEMISGNLWGGYGRRGGIQTQLNELPVPSSGVFDNLMNVTMPSTSKQELLDLYVKMFGK